MMELDFTNNICIVYEKFCELSARENLQEDNSRYMH